MIKSLIVFFLVIWINLEVFGQDSRNVSRQDEQIKQAEKDLRRARQKWHAVQDERVKYIDVTQDVGTRWTKTTWEMYRITRRKEMREKELEAIEDKAYRKWQAGLKWWDIRGKESKERWLRESSAARELMEEHDRIRSKLNTEYITAINELNEKGLKGNDGIQKNLDQRQAEAMAEYRQARERLNILRGLTVPPPRAEPTELEKNLSKMQDLLDSVRTQIKDIDSNLPAAGETVAGPKEISPETQVQSARTAGREISNSQTYAIEKVREARIELEKLQNRMGQLIDEYARGQRRPGWSASWDDINSNIRYWQRIINSYLRDATVGAVQPQSGSTTGGVSSGHEHDQFGRDTGAGRGNLGPTDN